MQTITTNVYTLDELDEKAKEKAREWYREGNDYYFMSEYMSDFLIELLKENKIETNDVPKLYYSLSHCQGDGAMFECSGTYNGLDFTIKQSGLYYHAYSKEIDMPKASETEYKAFDELYVRICKKLEQAGYDFIESEDSDENVDENIIANEYTFTIDGTRFR